MPLYEYQCGKCKKRVEKIQSFSAEPLRVCEFCGGPLERLISAPAIRFKGSGWYVTDYAHNPASPAAKSESNGEATASKPDPAATPKSEPATTSATPAAAKPAD